MKKGGRMDQFLNVAHIGRTCNFDQTSQSMTRVNNYRAWAPDAFIVGTVDTIFTLHEIQYEGGGSYVCDLGAMSCKRS